jgi:plastocyanin
MIGGCAPEPPGKGLAALCKPALTHVIPDFATALLRCYYNIALEREKKMLRNILISILHIRRWFCLLTLGALVLLASCGNATTTGSTAATTNTPAGSTPTTAASTPTTATSGSTMKVTIMTDSSGSFAFSPATLTVPVGTMVTWTNMTGAPHTVTSDDGKSFDSGTANPISAQGGTFSFTFTKAGTFAYHCQFHTFMKGTIIVK